MQVMTYSNVFKTNIGYKMRLIILFIIGSIFISISKENIDESELVRVRVSSLNDSVPQGETFYLRFGFKLKKDWHIYWRNPGDSGIPTEIEFESQKGFEFGDIIWEIPEKIPFDDLANYGYSDSVTLVVPIKVSQDVENGDYKLKSNISWLVCKELCLPGDTSITTNIKVSDLANIETKYDDGIVRKSELQDFIKTKGKPQEGFVEVTFPYLTMDIQFFPYENGYFKNGNGLKVFKENNNTVLEIYYDEMRQHNPYSLNGLIVINTDKLTRAFEINSKIIYRSTRETPSFDNY